MPSATLARRPLAQATTWLPIAMLAVGAVAAILVEGRATGTGGQAAWWAIGMIGVCAFAASAPAHALVAVVLVLPIVPYVRYSTALGKSLPLVLAAAALVGIALSRATRWSRLLGERHRQVMVPTLAFASLLAGSVALVLLQRSDVLSDTLGSHRIGFFAPDWVAFEPQTTLPIMRSAAFLIGPVSAAMAMSLLARDQATPRVLSRERLLAAFLVTSVLNLGVGVGQVYIPGFPLPTLRSPVSGFFHNPVGLSLLMTLVTPVAIAVSLSQTRSKSFRVLAVLTVVFVMLLFLPIQQRSAHVGVAIASVTFVVGAGILVSSIERRYLRRLVGGGLILVVLLTGGIATAFARVGQWQDVLAAIRAAPLSTAWLDVGARLETNRMAFYMVADRPLGGYGVGGYESVLPAYYAHYGPLRQRYDHSIMNHPLHMMVDLGVLGVVTHLWLLAAFLLLPLRAVFARANRTATVQELDLVPLGCIAGAATFFLLSIWTGEWMYDATTSVPAFVLLAVSVPTRDPADTMRRLTLPWAVVALPAVYAVLFVLGV